MGVESLYKTRGNSHASYYNPVIKHKAGLLNLAEELSNVSKACKIMGVSRDMFYRYRELADEIEKQVVHQLWQVENYEWRPVFSGHSVSPDLFISDENSESSGSGRPKVAGGWVTSLTDIRINFPGVEEPVKYWQGHLTAVVQYF